MNFIFDPSLVFYVPLYKLDGDAFMSRDSCGHLCTVNGAVWGPGGTYFDGVDDYIDCGDSVLLDITESITLEAWLRLSEVGKSAWNTVVSRDDVTNRNYSMYTEPNDYLYMYIWIGGVIKGALSAAALQAKTWYHCAATYDGSKMKVYVNMVQGPPTSATGAIDNDDVSLTIGAREDGMDRLFKGTIGEVRVYNRALSVLEIQRNYLATKWRYR